MTPIFLLIYPSADPAEAMSYKNNTIDSVSFANDLNILSARTNDSFRPKLEVVDRADNTMTSSNEQLLGH